MIKKLILTSSVLATSLIAATDAQLASYFKTQIPVPHVKIDVTSRVAVENIKNMDYVTLAISDGSRTQKVSVFTQGEYIFPDVVDVKSGSIKDKMDKAKLISGLAKLYKKEDKSNIIVLGNDPKKPTLVNFTDPECPFCLKDIQNMEKKLSKYNVKIVFTPVHERSSLNKSVLIYKQTSNAKSVEEKIKILRKYFSGDDDQPVSDAEAQKIKDTSKKYFKAGLKGVPYYVAEIELLK